MSNPFMDKYQQQTAGRAGGGSGRRADLVAEVVAINPDEGVLSVKLDAQSKAVQDGAPEQFDVVISKYAPKSSRPDADFEGNVIDKRMAETFGSGEKVILEGVVIGAGNGPFPVSWVSSVPGGNPEKVVEGNFTVSGFQREDEFMVTTVQQWPKQAVSPEQFLSDETKAGLEAQIERHNQALDARENGGVMPPIKPTTAIAFRAVKDGEVVDFVPPVGYNKEAKRPISFEEAQGGYEGYKAHVETTYGKEASVEVIPVREYRVAPSSQNAFRGPVVTMAKTAGKVGPEAEMPPYGNSVLGVHGLIALSPGKLDRKGQRQGAENDWVSKVYASARKGPIHESVLGADGQPVVLNEMLREFNYPGNGAAQKAEQSETAAVAPDEATPKAEAPEAPKAEAPKAEAAAQPAEDEVSDDVEDMLDGAFAAKRQAKSAPGP